MDRIESQQKFKEEYQIGIINKSPMVDALTENKHGIDNPVLDLRIGSKLSILAPTPLVSTRVPFANSLGQLVDDSDMTFSGSRLTVTDLTSTNAPIVSSLTATRLVYAGASKELVGSANLTYDASFLSTNGLKIVGTKTAIFDVSLLASSDKTFTFPNTSGTFALTSSAYTDEQAQDAVGTILTDSESIDFTYNDGTPSITAVVQPMVFNNDQLISNNDSIIWLH